MKTSSVLLWRCLSLALFTFLGPHAFAQNTATPVVHLELVDPNAAETLIYQNAIFWAEFRVVRSGDTAQELLVFLNTQQGSARFGEDYWLDGVDNGTTVRFRAGQSAVNVRLYPIDDDFYEGDETVFFHLIAPPYMNPLPDPYQIDHTRSSVSMLIRDNDPITTRLDITVPREGQHFQAGEVIELRAQVIGPGSTNAWAIDFFDGNQLIGRTHPNVPIWWDDATGGQHAISARAHSTVGGTLETGPIGISVGPGPALPVVSISVEGYGKTGEPCPVCFVVPAVFTVSRTGPTNEALNVYLEYDGSATPGVDYPEPARQVTIPAARRSVQFHMLPLDDLLVEGPEIVRATLMRPELATGGYIVSYYASQAMAVIYDNGENGPEIRLDIVQPKEGAQFTQGTTIQISALAVWTEGEVNEPVQFFAGDTFIGQSDVQQSLRPTIPGLPSVHTILWANVPSGLHVLTARFASDPNVAVTSPPVNIAVVSIPPPRPLVSIAATRQIAEESSYPLRRLPLRGEFTISRTGPMDQALHVFVHYSGAASYGVDYPGLPREVTIPAGAASMQIEVVPIDDSIPEGIETLVAAVTNCMDRGPLFGVVCSLAFEPAPQPATVYITDDAITRAGITITKPKDGDTFNYGETINIQAIAIDLDGYISRVEFWDGEKMIGISEIIFIREPDPGTPIHHSFAWRGAEPGSHALTARAVRGDETLVMSGSVHIEVERSNQSPRVAITRPASGSDFPADTPIEMVTDTTDPDGYVPRMEFFANGRKIGEVNVVFIRPPDPGQPQTFTFVWRQATPGRYALTARATDNEGSQATSAPVEISVGASEPLPLVTVTVPDPFAVEPRSNSVVNTATFRIRRHGPTNSALTIAYSLGGAAENGIDYQTLSGTVTIPAGQRSVPVVVRPLADNLHEGIETVRLRLDDPPSPAAYRLGRRRAATAVISDYPWLGSSARCIALAGGLKHLCFAADSGNNFRIEATSDLRTWETLFDTSSSEDGWHFIDGEIENQPYRFYRLTPEPFPDPE